MRTGIWLCAINLYAMTNTNKRFVSHLGFDYTLFVKTDEHKKWFDDLCKAERLSDGVPLKDCIHHVATALNLDAKLRNLGRKVHVQGNAKDN
jgi:hypothetical protein